MSNRGSGKRLNDSQKLDIIRKLQKPKPPSKRAIAREFNASENTIRKTWSNQESILNRTALMSNSALQKSFRASAGRFAEIEDVLYMWIDTMRRAKLEVPPSLALAKAKEITETKNIPESEFKASWQWLKNFRSRKGLESMLLYGEGTEVDKNDPDFLRELNVLYELIAQYDVENVYNMDETGLFYRILPRYTLLMQDEDLTTTRGKKKSKDRISLVVCCNSTGPQTIPYTIIAKPKAPACIRGRNWPIPYYSQTKAWMDVEVWKWFNEVFFPLVKQRTGRPVLLLLDNAPGHFDAFERDGVKFALFPPNCTIWKQPYDMGIIAALKKRYKYLYLKDVLSFYDLDEEIRVKKKEAGLRLRRGAAGVEFGRPAHILDAASYIRTCWDAIGENVINNCFKKAEIMNFDNDVLDAEANENIEENDSDIFQLVQEYKNFQEELDDQELDQFIHIDCEDSGVFNQGVLEDVEEVLENLHNNELPVAPNEVDVDEEDAQEDELPVERNFEGFLSLYRKLLDIKIQISLRNMKHLGVEADFDRVMQDLEKLEHHMRRLSRLEQQKNQRITKK